MKKAILYIFLIIIVVLLYAGWSVFGPTIHNPEKKFLYIKTGSNYQQVKDSLVKNKMISGDFWIDKIADYSDYPQKVKPGKYKIENGMSLYHLMKMLRSGRQVPVNLVVTKLRTKEDLAKKISTLFETDSLKAIQFLNNNDSLQPFNVDSNTVMTDVIPDTYTYTWNTHMKNIFKKLYEQEQKFWTPDRLQKAQRLQLSPQQVYTLASIVEEEKNKLEDK